MDRGEKPNPMLKAYGLDCNSQYIFNGEKYLREAKKTPCGYRLGTTMDPGGVPRSGRPEEAGLGLVLIRNKTPPNATYCALCLKGTEDGIDY